MNDNGILGFVPPSGGRNTMSLVHGCVWTVIICSWSSIHPNLPSSDDSKWDVIVRRAKWMLVGIVAPEYVAFVATREWYEVRWLLKEIRRIMALRRSKHTDGQMTGSILIGADVLSPGLLPDEGVIHGDAREGLDQEAAIALECLDKQDRSQSIRSLAKSAIVEDINEDSQHTASGPVPSADDDEQISSESAPQLTVEYAYYVYMGGFELLLSEKPTVRLNALQFLDFLKNGQIDLPDVSTKTIRGLSKSDVFAKSWPCVQMFWFITVLVTRVISRRPLTTLELYTAGQVCCTLASYFGWWKKPKNVEVPTPIRFKGKLEDVQVIRKKDVPDKSRNDSRVGNNDTINRRRTGMKLFTLVGFLPTLVFGTCHLLGWYQYFNTPAEKILWRTSSVCCLVLPLAAVALGDITRRGCAQSLSPGISVLVYLYVVFRMYIYVEMFAGLRQVPSAVYEDSNWTRYIPHVGS